MRGRSRYEVSQEGAGLSGGVLKNRFGITDQRELDKAEALLLSLAYQHFMPQSLEGNASCTLDFLFRVHKVFLGKLYDWAGTPRTVDISKESVLFAPVQHLSRSLGAFGEILERVAPLSSDTKREVAQKAAVIHDEFNALHPFREGNGRTIRLFLDVIVSSVGWQQISWGTHRAYMNACRRGMSGDHAAMENLVFRGLRRR